MTRSEEINKEAIYRVQNEMHSKEWEQGFYYGALWADEHPKKIPTKLDVFDDMTFDVNTPQFLKEAAENCIGGVYGICWNIFRNLLAQVAERATELHDPVMDALMIKLNLYEMQNEQRRPTIKKLQQIFEGE